MIDPSATVDAIAQAIPEWTGDIAALRQVQLVMAARLLLKDDFPKPLRTVAGLAVAAGDNGVTTRAAAVLLDAVTLQPLESRVALLSARMPRIPGLSSFHELPVLLDAWSQLSTQPDLVFIDGHGIAHPHRLGIAAHFGIASGLPTIGVAEEILVGSTTTALHDMRGAFTTLRDGGEQVGWLLRSKLGCAPVVVSPGHRVAMASVPELVMRFIATSRLPEPTRLADQLVARRDE